MNERIYSALEIGVALLRIAEKQRKTLTSMQLVKMVYIAQGWALAIRGRPLFYDRIEAWKYGPVIPNLYRQTKGAWREPVPAKRVEKVIGLSPDEEAVNKEVNQFLEYVFERYGHYTGIELSALTHRKGTPWDMLYKKNELGTEIPNELLCEHYEGKLIAAS